MFTTGKELGSSVRSSAVGSLHEPLFGQLAQPLQLSVAPWRIALGWRQSSRKEVRIEPVPKDRRRWTHFLGGQSGCAASSFFQSEKEEVQTASEHDRRARQVLID